MKITVDGTTYDYDPDTLRNDEAMALEAALSMTFKQWSEQLTAGSVGALTGLVWLVKRREEPALRFSEVQFAFSSLNIEDDSPAVPPTEPVELDPASS